MPDEDTAKLLYRVERTEYADIEIDVAALLDEWAEDRSADDCTDAEFVEDVLWKIGVQDLTYDGDFVRVLDSGVEESITSMTPHTQASSFQEPA